MRHERGQGEPPIRVAVIGGGCAAMATAYELSRPEHRGRYQVTVYQMGFRLGGKGASGRGFADRIEEHGLHLWMGFYENAFRIMRECYAVLGRDWREGFEPAPDVAVLERCPRGNWLPWIGHFPPGRGYPGDPLTAASPFTVRGYLVQAANLIGEFLRSILKSPSGPLLKRGSREETGLWEAVNGLLKLGQLTAPALLLTAVELQQAMLRTLPLLEPISRALRRQLEALASTDLVRRRMWQFIDVALAILRGCIKHGVVTDKRGFDALNEYEWSEWLRHHGATESSLECGFVRAIYDLCFAYQDADVRKPRMAAGAALRGALRMFFTYRGSLFWRMTAGMGDVAFAPLYEVCRRRGVRFEFFHRLRNVGVRGRAGPGLLPHVDRLEFDVQARINWANRRRPRPERGVEWCWVYEKERQDWCYHPRPGCPLEWEREWDWKRLEQLDREYPEYDPLVYVHGIPCWPSQPNYAQLEDGDRLRKEGWEFETPWETRTCGQRTLRVGVDFDLVVLGVGLGAVPHVGRELLAHEPAWRRACHYGRTAATQSVQLWMRESMPELGWEHPQINLSGYLAPFDTWADMRHLIPAESWRSPVRSIAYLVSVLPEACFEGIDPRRLHHEARKVVRKTGVEFLKRDVRALWPRAVDRQGRFRWEVLVCDKEAGSEPQGEERFASQFWMANVNPTDRYSLSVPGSLRHRISPLAMHFDNLTVAGDWTQSGLDTGCVESAVMSGLLAAHAVSGGDPPLESIVGYDHP